MPELVDVFVELLYVPVPVVPVVGGPVGDPAGVEGVEGTFCA